MAIVLVFAKVFTLPRCSKMQHWTQPPSLYGRPFGTRYRPETSWTGFCCKTVWNMMMIAIYFSNFNLFKSSIFTPWLLIASTSSWFSCTPPYCSQPRESALQQLWGQLCRWSCNEIYFDLTLNKRNKISMNMWFFHNMLTSCVSQVLWTPAEWQGTRYTVGWWVGRNG